MRTRTTRLCLLAAFTLIGLTGVWFNSQAQKPNGSFSPAVPRAWDDAELASLEVLLANPSTHPNTSRKHQGHSLAGETLSVPAVSDDKLDQSHGIRLVSPRTIASLYAGLQRFQRLHGPAGLEFAAHLAFYPNCTVTYIDD